jgi:hypothetical protein
MHNDSISAHGNRDNILEAKRRLPLPQLMAQLGHGDAAKKSARCPFHDDSNNSFSVFQNEDGWHGWKCFRGCGQGDEIEFLAKVRSLQKGAAIREFLKLAGVDNGKPPIRRESLDWKKCVADFSEADEQKLAAWRGLSIEFVRWLHAQNSVGIFEGKIAFANHGDVGAVVSAHFRLDSGIWNFKPKGHKTAPLIFGNPKTAGFVMVFESQFDAFAVMDKFGWHTSNGLPDTAVLITRSAANGKLIAGRLSPDAVCYAFKQNDVPTPKKPIPAGDVWLAEIASNAGCKVLNVATPEPHKDANDWTRAGASEADLHAAMKSAKPVQPQAAQDSNRADIAAGYQGDDVEQPQPSLIERLEARIYSAQIKPVEPMPRFYLAGVQVSTAGNLTTISASAKAGKSAAVGAMIGSTYAASDADCLGFTSENPNGFAVVHLDTEQWLDNRHTMKPNQPQLPFSTAPIDFTQGVECRFGQLAAVNAAAKRAGFVAIQLRVIKLGYRVDFQRVAPAAQKSAVLNQSPNQNAVASQPDGQAM